MKVLKRNVYYIVVGLLALQSSSCTSMGTPENIDETQVEEYIQEERAREESTIKIQGAARKHLCKKRAKEEVCIKKIQRLMDQLSFSCLP